MVILFRLLIIVAVIILMYSVIKYFVDPKRKLELAHDKKQFYFHDDKTNVRKNFLLTYKGVLFEGEKYLGTTDMAFEIVSIVIWPKQSERLQGLDREDFHVIEQEIYIHYPNATIEWKSPVKEFLRSEK